MLQPLLRRWSCSRHVALPPLPGVRRLCALPSSSSLSAPAADCAPERPGTTADEPRNPKKKIAMVVAYDGSHFLGSQYNKTGPTVDGVLLHALLEARAIDAQKAAQSFGALMWSRASRTDRGVHALSNVVTVKVRIPASEYAPNRHAQPLAERLNSHLPPYIRVLSCAHVPGGFSAHHDAEGREYCYALSAAALDGAPIEAVSAILAGSERSARQRRRRRASFSSILANDMGATSSASSTVSISGGAAVDSPSSPAPMPPFADEPPERRLRLRALQALLDQFVGVHAFHNFMPPGLRATSVAPSEAHLRAHWREGAPANGSSIRPRDSKLSSASRRVGDSRGPSFAAKAAADAPQGLAAHLLSGHVPVKGDETTVLKGSPNSAPADADVPTWTQSFWDALGIDIKCGIQPKRDSVGSSWSAPRNRAEGASHVDDNDAGSSLAVSGAFSPRQSLNDSAFSRFYTTVEQAQRERIAARGEGVNIQPESSYFRADARAAAAALDGCIGKWSIDPACIKTIFSCRVARIDTAAAAASDRVGEEDVPPLYGIRLHGSSFHMHQIRFMVGTALAILYGALPRNYIQAALHLPLLHRLPLAPAAGLFLADVHFAPHSYVRTRSAAANGNTSGGGGEGTQGDASSSFPRAPSAAPIDSAQLCDESASPIVSQPLREAFMDDPSYASELHSAVADAPDISLLLRRHVDAQAAFFATALLPRLRFFAEGAASSSSSRSDSNVVDSDVVGNDSTARGLLAATASAPMASARLAFNDVPPPVQGRVGADALTPFAPPSPLHPVSLPPETLLAWLRSSLRAHHVPSDARVCALATRAWLRLRPSVVAAAARRARAVREQQTGACRLLWGREGKRPPLALRLPVHLSHSFSEASARVGTRRSDAPVPNRDFRSRSPVDAGGDRLFPAGLSTNQDRRELPSNASQSSRDASCGGIRPLRSRRAAPSSLPPFWRRHNNKMHGLVFCAGRHRSVFGGGPPHKTTKKAPLPPPVRPTSSWAGSLFHCRLAEVQRALLPSGTRTAIVIATGVTRGRDVAHVVRCIVWRISQGEWPPVATARQHARWAARTGVEGMITEGKWVYLLERTQARCAARDLKAEKRVASRASAAAAVAATGADVTSLLQGNHEKGAGAASVVPAPATNYRVRHRSMQLLPGMRLKDLYGGDSGGSARASDASPLGSRSMATTEQGWLSRSGVSAFEYVRKFELDDALLPGTYIVVRVDGRGFSRFTSAHGYLKPNDARGLALMNQCAASVMREWGDIVVAFGESDEYSFVLPPSCGVFGRRSAKLATGIASLFASSFVFYWPRFFADARLLRPPSFDARCVVYPNARIVSDYLRWRQVDTHINTLHNEAFWALVQKGGLSSVEATEALKGTVSSQKHELLFTRFGINYAKLPIMFRRGTTILRIGAWAAEMVATQRMPPAGDAAAPPIAAATERPSTHKLLRGMGGGEKGCSSAAALLPAATEAAPGGGSASALGAAGETAGASSEPGPLVKSASTLSETDPTASAMLFLLQARGTSQGSPRKRGAERGKVVGNVDGGGRRGVSSAPREAHLVPTPSVAASLAHVLSASSTVATLKPAAAAAAAACAGLAIVEGASAASPSVAVAPTLPSETVGLPTGAAPPTSVASSPLTLAVALDSGAEHAPLDLPQNVFATFPDFNAHDTDFLGALFAAIEAHESR